jgi:Transposase, Mutator family
VATFERDFEQTIAYYALDEVARELIRTTSLLERTNRELRRKFRQVCGFGSPTGTEVAIYLQVKRLNARWSKQTWWEISHSLYFDFLNLNPKQGMSSTLLIIIYHVIAEKKEYEELGADYLDQLDRQGKETRLIRQLEKLGFEVSLTPTVSLA